MEFQKDLQCSICLEVFHSPVTTDCGHSFCSDCISKYWDRESNGTYSCPECRHNFSRRPQLSKNIRLCRISEAWKQERNRRNPGVSHDPSPGMSCDPSPGMSCDPSPGVSRDCYLDLGRFCQVHHRELKLYCHTEGVALCNLCNLQDHQTHQVGQLEEETERAQELIMKRQALVDLQHQATVDELSTWKDTITLHQGWLQQIRQEIDEQFEKLLPLVRKTQEELRVFLQRSENEYFHQAESFRKHLEDKLLHLRREQHDLQTLLQEHRPIPFLQGSETLKKSPDSPLELANQPEVPKHLSQLSTATKVLSDLLKDQLEAFTQLNIPTREFPGQSDSQVHASGNQPTAHSISTAVSNAPSGSPQGGADAVTLFVSSPIQRHQTPPQTRQDLLQYLSVVTFDPNTASDWLLLSDDLKLVTNTHPKNQNYPKHTDRFTRQHQVLAIQEFAAGIHYWEVSVSGCSARVGVAYRQINRTDRGSASILGGNEVSWCLELDQGSGIAWHNHRNTDPVPVPYQCLGLLLDFPCQTLSFYGIRDHAILLLHQFKTSFTQSLLPAFQISRQTRIQIENKTPKLERQIPIGNRS
ncbi:tripartite motif-containing protein 16-like protein [Stegostoma tigrinum]|uniref:tripartite motif-containing protein 16-like protein n=1 Tax=Stegostoma tigrinum TaxID=3053191 RepID=UPI0028709B1A|nr:tripartite motif-containing protein 16-like protein [Stegostoma tigrinum]